MQTHDDQSHERRRFLQSLKAKAERMVAENQSTITGGGTDEEPLTAWQGDNGMHVRHLPDDEHGVCWISVGGGEHLPFVLNYCVVRGKVGQCIKLLETAGRLINRPAGRRCSGCLKRVKL